MNIDLRLGDCLEVLPMLPPACADMVMTSPPYYNARDYASYASYDAYIEFIVSVLAELKRVVRPCGILALNLSCVIVPRAERAEESVRLPIPFDIVYRATRMGLPFVDDIIWIKPDGASSRAVKFSHHRRPVAYKTFQVTEYLIILKNGAGLLDNVIRSHGPEVIEKSLVADGYERTNVWHIPPERVNGHPAAFPLKLAENAIGYYSFVGDTVLDCFMGSGTSGIACAKLGRNFIGIEKDRVYYELANKLVYESQLQMPLTISDIHPIQAGTPHTSGNHAA